MQQACTQPITLYNRSSWRFPHNMIRTGLTWFFNQTGDGASNHLEAGGFVRTKVSSIFCISVGDQTTKTEERR